jgi:diadenosine tetraphosphatase ApaH/serine/threonine PP2A family protein phosphatase
VKIGIYSDVHGNLEALEAVLSAFSAEGISRLWCLGDLVGYGANPNECIARARETTESFVLGNHDAAVVGLEETTFFNRYAREAVQWTAAHLSDENYEWLRRLPLTVTENGFLLVHSSPFEPENWHYITRVADVLNAFNAINLRAAFVGHTHQPMLLMHREEQFFQFNGTTLKMEEGYRYLVNVGSVGQPRDGNPEAAYAVFDEEDQSVTLKRVSYDVATAQRKIREAGLPDVLAVRLASGT